MGVGYSFTCRKCKKVYGVHLGIGFAFPIEYGDTVKAAEHGDYGKEIEELMKSNKYMSVDAEEVLYLCGCGAWKVEKDMSVYAPKNVARVEKMKYGDSTVGELGEIPYLMEYDRNKYFKLVRKSVHKCDQCGSEMRKIDEEAINELPCPKCKTVNVSDDTIYWD